MQAAAAYKIVCVVLVSVLGHLNLTGGVGERPWRGELGPARLGPPVFPL